MFDNLKLYYSIDDLILNYELENLVEYYSNNSINYYKTELWGENNVKYGDLIYQLEIKYDKNINYYTFGKIIILLNNNIYIEGIYNNNGCVIDYLTEKYNINSSLCTVNNNIIDKIINIKNEYYINDDNVHGIISLQSI